MPESRVLPLHPLPAGAGYFVPFQELPDCVRMDSPATSVMTDLRQQVAVTIEPDVSIDWALQRMKSAGVRLLLVVDTARTVLGLITSTDIQGEKPIKFREELSLRHEEIVVRDIMTPRAELDVVELADLRRAAVADVVELLQQVGRRHALVLDRDARTGAPAIRGILSASRIEKQLGQSIETISVARTFAQVESALNSPV